MSNQKKMLILAAVLLVGFLGLYFQGIGTKPTPQEIHVQSDIPEGEDFFERLEKNEADLLATTGEPKVTREGRSLRILPASGSTVILEDCIDCGPEKDVEHFLVERFSKPDGVLIYRQLYEGDDFLWITARGESHTLPAYPVLSPDRTHLLVVSASEAFNWNGLEVWEFTTSGLQRVFQYEPETSEIYQFLSWSEPRSVQLRFSGYEDEAPVCRAVELRQEKGLWKRVLRPDQIEGFCPPQEDWVPRFLRRQT